MKRQNHSPPPLSFFPFLSRRPQSASAGFSYPHINVSHRLFQSVTDHFEPKEKKLLHKAVAFIIYFLFLKIKLRNRITFITRKNPSRMIQVSTGCLGARVASSIRGKPNTMAGKF